MPEDGNEANKANFDILAGGQWWRKTFLIPRAFKRAYNHPSLSGRSRHGRSGPLSSRFLHDKSVVILKERGETKVMSHNSQHWNQGWSFALPHFQCPGRTWCECLLTENSEPEGEAERGGWRRGTGAEPSAWAWRTVAFACNSNFGWRLNGTPSRAAGSWADDDCVANTCCDRQILLTHH